MRRPLANALDIDLAGGLTEQVTPHAGAAMLIEALRRSGVVAAAERHLPAKKSMKGLRQGELGEAFIHLIAYVGFPSGLTALEIASEVIGSRK